MRLSSITSLTADQLDEWRRLASAAAEPNPFFEPSFVTAAARAEGDQGASLLYDERDGAWTGCIPVERRRLGLSTVLVGWRSHYTYLGTPLVDRDATPAFATALVGALADSEFGRYLLLQRASKGPVSEAIADACDESGRVAVLFERIDGRAALVRGQGNDYLAGMKSRKRSELRRQRKKLEAELETDLASRQRTDLPAAIDAFMQLEAAGWKGREGTAMASATGTADLFKDICTNFADEGRLLLRSLEGSDRVTAMTCDIAAGDVLFGFKAAYDEGLRRYSPGVLLQIDNFEAFEDDRSERMLDSCGEPSNGSMNALWPGRREIATMLLGPGGPIGRTVGRAVDRAARYRRDRANPA
jgi:CelD/BcsL family acetyltransferase involved in cellulose biosynthesis